MELGSDFELDLSELSSKHDSVYQYLQEYNTIFLDSGRSASRILNSVLKKGTILLPDYICESVLQVYQNQFRMKYYHINRDFSIDIDDFLNKMDDSVTAVYLMHYFGMIQGKEVLAAIVSAKKRYAFTVIEDTTHSIFTKSQTIGDYCICSLRKWFPVTDGGVLYSDQKLKDICVQDIPVKDPSEKLTAMLLKKLYIDGKLDCNDLYREIFIKEEQKLDQQCFVYQISDISRSLLKYFSVSDLKNKRKKNFSMLYESVYHKKMDLVIGSKDAIPLVCPIYIEDRDEFRRYLMNNHVYCAVHWPLKETELYLNEETISFSKHIISLPIDQRYNEKHMRYLCKLVNDYVS